MKNHKPDLPEKTDKARRGVVAGLAGSGLVAGSGMLPGKWTKPVVETVILPAHAETSDKRPESDRRLKESVERIAGFGGVSFYRWQWNELANELRGLSGSSVGVIAQEVAGMFPEAIGRRGGFMTVDYKKLVDALVSKDRTR